MSTVTLTLTELGAVVFLAVLLATTDAAAVSRLALAFASKKLGVKPGEIRQYDSATDGDGDDGGDDGAEGNT